MCHSKAIVPFVFGERFYSGQETKFYTASNGGVGHSPLNVLSTACDKCISVLEVCHSWPVKRWRKWRAQCMAAVREEQLFEQVHIGQGIFQDDNDKSGHGCSFHVSIWVWGRSRGGPEAVIEPLRGARSLPLPALLLSPPSLFPMQLFPCQLFLTVGI